MSVENLITEHLDIWTSAIKTKSAAGRGSSKKLELVGVKKLRELILELAVRGKLVSQDINDEPASELLKKIETEKARLVKEGKIKRQKPIALIPDEEKPFVQPTGWEWEMFGNLCEIERGGSPRPINSYITEEENGLNWIKISDTEIGGKYITNTVEKIRPEGLKKTRQVYPGDFLLTNSMSFGRPYITKIEGCIHDGWLRISPPDSLDKDYLYSLLSSPYIVHSFRKSAAGAVVMNLNADKVRDTAIALPPLKEQHRIVAKVDELMALCDQLESQTESSIQAHQLLVETLLATLSKAKDADELFECWQRISQHFDLLFTTQASIDKLKQTILQLAVMGKLVKQDPNDEPAAKLLERIATEKQQLIKAGKIKKQKTLPPITGEEKPFELSTGWEWCALSELITVMDAGWSPACPPEPSPNEDVWGVLKTTAVQNMEFRAYENKTLPDNKEPKPQYEVKVGDILITRAGPKNRVGVSCLVQETRSRLMISDKLIRFHLINIGLSERFISLCLNAGATAEYLESAKSGMAESQMNISQDKLKSAPVPLCPLNEQIRIISKVDELMALCDSLKVRLNQAQITQLHFTDAIVEQKL